MLEGCVLVLVFLNLDALANAPELQQGKHGSDVSRVCPRLHMLQPPHSPASISAGVNAFITVTGTVRNFSLSGQLQKVQVVNC